MTIDEKELNVLKSNLSKALDEINKEINHAIMKNNGIGVEELKRRATSCEAQIRLIKHIESGLSDKNYIMY